MIATRTGQTITISDNIARALAGFSGGYTVHLFGLPGFEHIVDAGTVDKAHAMALTVAQKEGKCLVNTGARIQAR